MNKEEFKKLREERMAALKKDLLPATNDWFEVLDEATMHVVDHWNNEGHDPQHNTDYALVMGRGYLGENAMSGQEVVAQSFLFRGDWHALSHNLAEMMRTDRKFARIIFHALEVFAREATDNTLQ